MTISYFFNNERKHLFSLINLEMAPGGRFELPFPCENALYGKLFPGARPTRLGDPGTVLRQKYSVKCDYILCYSRIEKLFPNCNCSGFLHFVSLFIYSFCRYFVKTLQGHIIIIFYLIPQKFNLITRF